MIITLCGSARFERWFKAWNLGLTFAGHSVFSLTAYPSDFGGIKTWYTDAEKELLDQAHLRKIEASNAIFVINRLAYIGESTLREVQHAKKLNQAIYFLESWGQGLGVNTGEFKQSAIDQARNLKIELPTASPIDTTTRVAGQRDPWSSSLLPGPGVLRSKIVDLVRSVETD